MSLVKPDLSEITIPPIFCGSLREKNTHLERLDDTTDRYDISWKVANTSNCILIYNVGIQEVQYGFLLRCLSNIPPQFQLYFRGTAAELVSMKTPIAFVFWLHNN